ncbi:MAG: hypothetical protein NVS2B16_01850 [Chloroflexota bacterium]
MYVLIVKGARRATLAYHRCEALSELNELVEVYRALGYSPDALLVEERGEEKEAA